MTVHPAHARRTRAPHAGLTLLLAPLALALAAAACGGAEPAPAKTPAYESERRDKSAEEDALAEPRTIEEAQAQIAQARAMLEPDHDTKASSESTAPRPEPPSAPPPSTSPHGGATAPARRQEPADACGSPCRALASMKRAVEALCRMTGDTDDRCVDAKRTLGESTSRVATCRCESR